MELDVEVIKDNMKGSAGIKIFGPNSRKGYTVMVNKAKKSEKVFAKVLALDVIKPLIDKSLNLLDWNDLLKNTTENEGDELRQVLKLSCNLCDKLTVTSRSLKIHMKNAHEDGAVTEENIKRKASTKTKNKIKISEHNSS